MTTGRTGEAAAATALVEEALDLVETAPARAQELARAALARARAAGDRDTACGAERALGMAAIELGRLRDAVRHLRRALALAEGAGLVVRAGEARRNLIRALAEQGDGDAALAEADVALPDLGGMELARMLMMRSIVLERLGRMRESIDGYGRALAIVRRAGDARMEGRTLCNRGLAHAIAGDLTAAEADLSRAEALMDAGADGALAKTRHNLGIVAARMGDAPRALTLFERAEEQFRAGAMRLDHAILPRDRAVVLLSVRLVPEARASAERAVSELQAVGARATWVEAMILLAECLILEGDPRRAREVAKEAARACARQRRRGWELIARSFAARAGWEAGLRTPAALAEVLALRAQLEEVGFRDSATEASLIAARMALDLGLADQATAELARTSRLRRRGTGERVARAWHAEALLRLQRGDGRGAEAALRAGLAAVERSRARLGASELRAHAAGLGEELAALGLRLALAGGRPRHVLAWAERWRAGGLWGRPPRPPEDADFAADLGELRQLTALGEAAQLEGRDERRLARRRDEVEARIVRRARRTAGADAGPDGRPDLRALAETLGERALLELVEADGVLWLVALAGGRARLHRLGDAARVRAEVEAIRFGLRRLALGWGSEASIAAARQSVRHSAARLDDLLLAPARAAVADRPLVVVPTGALHALPWAALPSAAGRPIAVAPSAALWLRAARRPPPPASAPVVLAAGPGLPWAQEEVASLGRAYGPAIHLTGSAATAAAVSAAIDGAALAHVAAHGAYRADNPHFSALRLADGPLTVYDLERLRRPPATLVLSACDSGLSAVRPGDELMGLAAALLAAGTGCVIASVGLAPDEATRPLMVDLHRRLRAGAGPAAALASAQAAIGAGAGDPDAILAARTTFVCLGAG